MSEEELLKRCSELTNKNRLHWVSEVYGFGGVIRKFGYYPKFLPLNIYLAHGVTVSEKPAAHELQNPAPVMVYFSARLVKAFKNESSKPCYSVISPNVFYRRSKNIVRDSNAKGTLAFLGHTTPTSEDKMNLMEYVRQLKELPEKYHPVTVCLHFHDVNKAVYKIFFNEGFDVVTVGNPFHDSFMERFYEIIRKYRYTTSNDVGSYTFYAPEMGIPFFLYGNEPDFYNYGDPNIESGKYDSYTRTNQYKKIKKLFSHPVDEVTTDQQLFVEEELGVLHSISRLKMARILYSSYFILRLKELKIKIHYILTLRWLKHFLEHKLPRLKLYHSNYKKFGFNFAKSFYSNRKTKSVELFGNKLSYTNEFWFLHGMQEIFLDKTYWFKSESPKPIIIDCGSNIGLSLIYFKHLYNDARIIGFEPDPLNFAILKKNIASFGFNDIEIYNKAIWSKNTTLQFASSESSVGSKLAVDGISDANSTNVGAVALSTYLKDHVVDFLKIDIEGAELEVMRSCKDHLWNVKNLFIEYHSLPHEPQQLHELLQIIHESGFRYYMKEAWENIKHPYVFRNPPLFDLQLNIFAYR